MKKLMIAAAIVCAAVASEAASFTWTTGSAEQYMPTTWGKKVAGDGQTPATSGTTKTITAWADNGMAFTASILLSTDNVNWTPSAADVEIYSDGGIIATEGFSNTVFAKPTDGTKDIYYKVVINGTYTDDEGTWTATATIGGTKDDYITLTSMSPDDLITGTASSWNIAHEAVPEPTSGLLLLLGVAGLALRRRRA